MKYELMFSAVLALISYGASADEVKYISPGHQSPFLQAAIKGNESFLEAFAERNPQPVVEAFASAAVDRARFDLASSAKKASECSAAAKALRPPELSFLLACSELRVGNALLAGRFKDWATEAALARSEVRPHLPRTPGTELRDAALEAPDVAAFLDWPAPSVASRTIKGRIEATASELPALRGLVSVKAKANGVSLAFVVDSGAQITILSRADAARVKAKQSPVTVMEVAPASTAHGVTVKAALVDTLELGAFRVSHANIGVWDQPFSVLGMDVLLRLPDPVRLNHEGIFFGGSDLPATCNGRLFLQSELGGRPASLYLSGTLDGVAKDFLVDTGNDGAVSRRASPGDAPGKTIDVMTVSGPTTIQSTMSAQPARLGANERTEQVRLVTGDIVPDQMIGAGVLGSDRTLWLSWTHHRGCVSPSGVTR
jgi:predicted aspartyl protease